MYVGVMPVGGGSSQQMQTDANGAYSFKVALGDYALEAFRYHPNAAAAPSYFDGYNYNNSLKLTVTQDTTFDIALPFKRVGVHVQDQAGNAVPAVVLTTDYSYNGGLQIGRLTFTGRSYYDDARATTDTSGDGEQSSWEVQDHSGRADFEQLQRGLR